MGARCRPGLGAVWRGGALALLPLSAECESERGAWSRCVIAGCGPGRSRSRRGPADWLRARTHVTDMWLYWRSPPGCHWRRDGGAAGLGNGVGAGAALARLAAWVESGRGARGRLSSLALSKAEGLTLAQGLQPHAKRKGRGVSPHLSPTAAPEMDFLCFGSGVFDRRGRRGRGTSVKGRLLRESRF